MTYDEMVAAIRGDKRGHTFVLGSLTGGLKRYAKLHMLDDDVICELMGTKVAEVHPDGSMRLWNGGYRTMTTRDILNNVVLPRGVMLWSHKRQWIISGSGHHVPFSEGMTFDVTVVAA